MTTPSLFTSINYKRHASYAETTLSNLSNYFYLGGKQATVISGDQILLENRKISSKMTALKVVSYVLTFPLTLILLVTFIGLRAQHHFVVIKPNENSNKKIEIPAYARAFCDDHSISEKCKELFKLIFVETINPDIIESSQPLGRLVEEQGELAVRLKEFGLGCRGSDHSSNKTDPWQTIKITAPNITRDGETSPILSELKRNLDTHYHLKSGGGDAWQEWLKLDFEVKMRKNKYDPRCFLQNGTVMTPQLLLSLIDLRKIFGLIKDDKAYITALEQAYPRKPKTGF